MRFVKMALVMALAGFWALAINHCRIEAVSEIDLLTCAPSAEESHEHEPQDCEDDGCAVVEDGFYKASKTYVDVEAPILGHDLLVVHALAAPLHSKAFQSHAEPPADLMALAPRWQFLSRAAPPARAPTSAT